MRNLDALREIRARLCRDHLAEGNYSEVLNAIGQPTNQGERDLAALCHYELAKKACLAHEFGIARSHAAAVEQIKPKSRVMRSLNAARLKLLNTPHSKASREVHSSPGIVTVEGIGDVPVLDKYVTYGHRTDMTKHVRFLKKAPQELEEHEIEERRQLIEDLGFALLNVLRHMSFTADIDMLVPIPPDPDRYSIRMYHPPEAIAKTISHRSAIPMESKLLRKTRESQSLRRLSQYEREDEIKGSFEIDQDRQFVVKDGRILLVDDVVTYGTHFREAKRILLASGARSIHACALAAAHGRLVPIK